METKADRDNYAIIIGSGTWVMSLIILFLINIAFSSKAFFYFEQKLPKQTSANVISQQGSWRKVCWREVNIQRGE